MSRCAVASAQRRPRTTAPRRHRALLVGGVLFGLVAASACAGKTGKAALAPPVTPVPAAHGPLAHLRGVPASAPSAGSAPSLTVLTSEPGVSAGDIFVAPAGGGGYAAGPEILTTAGKVVWFHRLPAGDVATDFRTQTYLGHPVLTWLQSGGLGGQLGPGAVDPNGPPGVDYIYNSHYRKIATVRAGNGYATNFHEFLITPQNTALILADHVITADLTSIGGSAHQQVLDDVVQEIDIKTGRVLFQWDAAAHIPYSDTFMTLPQSPSIPWDWLHLNAVHLDTDGNLLVSARNTWTVYKLDRRTGQIMWELGGKHSSFTVNAAPGQALNGQSKLFAWQHDPEALGNGYYTVFDDESGGYLYHTSRVVLVHIDLASKTATLVKAYDQPEGQIARAMGNAQPAAGSNLFVGWGSLPYVSEFSAAGTLLFNAELPSGVLSYRAYLLPWRPAS